MSQPSHAPLRGRCLCGAVGYRITGPVVNFQYCHCSRCRKFTGSAHAANLFVAPEHLEWDEGSDASLGGFDLQSEPGFLTAFCRTCGSSMPSMSSTGRFWVVPAGALEDDPGVRPRRSIFYESRAPWFVPTGELPCHDELGK